MFKAIVKAFADLFTKRIFYRSATISYFSLILIFPLFSLIIQTISFLPIDLRKLNSLLEQIVPALSINFIQLVEKLTLNRITFGFFNAIIAFIFSSNLFIVISNSLAEVTETPHKSFAHQILVQIISVPIFILIILIVYVLGIIVSIINHFLLKNQIIKHLIFNLKPIISVSIIINIISIISLMTYIYYLLLPQRSLFKKSHIFQVIIITSVLFLVMKKFFTLTFIFISHYNPIYASFSSILAFLLWIYVSSAIILFGGRVLFYLKNN